MAILRELQEDGHMSLVELGRRVGLTAAPVQRRVRALERDGWISRYVALVEPRYAGCALEVFLEVELADESRSSRKRSTSCLRSLNVTASAGGSITC